MNTTVEIQNLKCAGCESTIAKKLYALPGITNISIDLDKCTVSFNYETDDGMDTVEKELSRLGYPQVGDTNNFGKKAKSFVSCAIGRLSSENQ